MDRLNPCACGRFLASHYYFEEELEGDHENPNLRWTIGKCTGAYPTEEYGTLAFQGVHGPNKSHFVRLDFTTEPADIYRLLVDVWGFEPPKLIITVHGGTNNFELPHNLAKALRKGLLKAAKTTNAWIITSGIRMGVVRHVVASLTETIADRKQKFTLIGIAPWGALRRGEDLLNSRGATVAYYLQSAGVNSHNSSMPNATGGSVVTGVTGRHSVANGLAQGGVAASDRRGRLVTLCENHSCFLLVDNGTVGRSGCEMFLRRRFEDYLKQRPLVSAGGSEHHGSGHRMPTVCLVLGGGKSTLQAVLSYVTSQPSVPVVVCDGSGRAADILAYAHQNQSRERDHPDAFKRHVFRMIEESFGVGELEAHKIYKTALLCSKWLNFSSIFSCDKDTNTTTSVESSNRNDLDCVILNTLLTGYKLSPVDKLGLLLTWNRDDMAREIFERGNHDWPENSLYQAMMYALVSDRVEFVQLLLNNGIAMDKFLTISRLEELYNTDRGPPNTLKFILQDVVKDPGPNYKFKLPHIGLIIEKLMGSGFRASYSRQDFRRRYKIYMCQKQQHRLSSAGVPKTSGNGFKTPADHVSEDLNDSRRFTFSTYNAGKVSHFQCPFAELFVWAVLTKRHNMAMCMWRQGDDQIAKALIGYKLNKGLAKEAEEDYLEVEVSQWFRDNVIVFQNLSYDLLETCYQTDDDLTLQLLTYELKHWSRKTCLSLAALSNYKKFIAHPCCQMLLADLWLGGLRIRKKAHLKVILSILMPPLILFLQFKTQEQLLLQAQTAEEFHENRPELTPDEEESYASSDSSSDSDNDDNNGEENSGAPRPTNSAGVVEVSSMSEEPSPGGGGGDLEAKVSNPSLSRLRVDETSPPGNAAGVLQSPTTNASRLSSITSNRAMRPSFRMIPNSRSPSPSPSRAMSKSPSLQRTSVWFSTSSKALLTTTSDKSPDGLLKVPTNKTTASNGETTNKTASNKQPSATKNEKEMYECAVMANSPPGNENNKNVQRPRNFIFTPRHSSDTTMIMQPLSGCHTPNAVPGMVSCAESESNTPLVSPQRRLLPHSKIGLNGLKHAGRTQTSIGFNNVLSRKPDPDFADFNHHFDTLPNQFSNDFRRVSFKQNQQLPLRKKIKEFYQAPIACFWSFVIFYVIFLLSFTYTVLIRTESVIKYQEYFVIFYITTFGIDQIRRVLLQEPTRLVSKWKVYTQQSVWDLLSCLACLMFFVAFFLRISTNQDVVMAGRVLYCCNIVFWYMRLLHIMTVSSVLGPYITMFGKMVAKMFLLTNILAVVLASFGVFRQSILFPHNDWDWELARNIVYKPYFMLYGELYAEEIDMCTDQDKFCVPGHNLVPLLMTIYLLLAIIVFVNMMIAAFNFVFMQVNSQSQLIWKFQRYEQVMEYEQQPFLPPPLIIFAHLYLMFKYFYRRIWKQDKVYRFEHSLKLFLSDVEVGKLHDFERECVEHMFTKKQAQQLDSTDERVKQINDKLENVGQKLDVLFERCNNNRFLMLLLQEKLNAGLNNNGNNLSGVGAALLDVNIAGSTTAGSYLSTSCRDLRPLGAESPSPSDYQVADHHGVGSALTVPQVGRRHRRSLTDISDAAPAKQPESLVKRLARGLRAQENVADAAAGLQRSVTWSTALKQPPAAATNSDDDAGGVDVPATCVRSPESAASNIFLPLSKNLSGTNQSLNSGIIMNVFGGGENAERPASGLNEQD